MGESMHEWARKYESARNSVRESARNSVRALNLLEILKISQPVVDDLDDQSTNGSQSFRESEESVQESVRDSAHEPARNPARESIRNSMRDPNLLESLKIQQLVVDDLDDQYTDVSQSFWSQESTRESARGSVHISVHEPERKSPWWSTRNSAQLHRWEMLEKLELALNNLDDRSTNGSWCGRESVQVSARESVRQSVHESAHNSAQSPPRGTLRSFCFVPLYENPVV